MGEREMLTGRCLRCGARAEAGGAGKSLAARACASLFAREARARSGLAYAAGFAGIVYLFKASAVAFAFGWLGLPAVFAYLWAAAAPAAMAMALLAACELDRTPSLAGRPQALVGFLIGLWGTLHLVVESQTWWRSL
jgi:hypothetical protein